jgi:hypothetical protein
LGRSFLVGWTSDGRFVPSGKVVSSAVKATPVDTSSNSSSSSSGSGSSSGFVDHSTSSNKEDAPKVDLGQCQRLVVERIEPCRWLAAQTKWSADQRSAALEQSESAVHSASTVVRDGEPQAEEGGARRESAREKDSECDAFYHWRARRWQRTAAAYSSPSPSC